jgi:hypothetical protein
MGSEYEGPASALIRTLNTEHATLTLSPDDQLLLANWVYKTSLMLECTKPVGPGVERGECIRFRNRGQPPSDCSIILGFCDHEALAYHRALITTGRDERIGYATTMVVGRLFFNVLGRGEIVRLYPRTGQPVVWPLAGYFTKDAVEVLANFAGVPFEFIT